MTRSGADAVAGMNARFMFFLRPKAQVMTRTGAGKPCFTNGARAGAKRGGFTLVEVIVVLVILAILAAIAIPALTGYIDKAQDKQYIADARNAAAALRSVLSEGYADGTVALTDDIRIYAKDGSAKAGDGGETRKIKTFGTTALAKVDSKAATGTENQYLYFEKAAKMLGTTFPNIYNPGYWELHFFAPNTSSYSIFNAPGYYYYYYPEGFPKSGQTKPMVVVTYGMKGLDPQAATVNTLMSNSSDTKEYDSSVGYKVFHVTYSNP
jgi:prepilin-type N-terminal cleavage/methylation domain-containing protein